MTVISAEVISDLHSCISRWQGVSRNDAEEILSESLLALSKKLSQGVVVKKPRHWLLKAARHVRRRFFKEKKLQPLLVADPVFPNRLDDEPSVVVRLRECIAVLPGPYKRAVELCDYGNLSPVEAAEVACIPWRTMQSQYRRAHERLRRMLLMVENNTAGFQRAG